MYISFPLVGSFNEELPLEFDPQRLINMYNIYDKMGKKASAATKAPGLSELLTFEDGTKVRRIFKFTETDLYVVVSEYVYHVSALFGATLLGTITTDSGYVGMAHNGNQVILVDGIKGYTIISNVLAEITDPGFPPKPLDVTYQDTYFIVVQGESENWQISDSGDGTKWDALKNAVAFSEPDTLIGVRQLHRMLFLFGAESIEVWTNQGYRDFPFRRQNNMLLQYGCAAAGSIARGFDKLLWLANDENGVGSIMMTDGTSPVDITPRSVDLKIQEYENIEDCRSYMYKENGHIFYVLNFTTDDHTWVADLTTKPIEWSERQMDDGSRHIAETHDFFQRKHVVGAYNAPILYEMSKDYYDNEGENFICTRISQPWSDEAYRTIRIDSFEVDIKGGIGTETGTDKIPQLFFSFSTDGGYTFRPIRQKSMGRIGNRTKRVIFRNLGTATEWVFKVQYYGKTEFEIMGAALNYSRGKI